MPGTACWCTGQLLDGRRGSVSADYTAGGEPDGVVGEFNGEVQECPLCSGTGETASLDICPMCDGDGKVGLEDVLSEDTTASSRSMAALWTRVSSPPNRCLHESEAQAILRARQFPPAVDPLAVGRHL